MGSGTFNVTEFGPIYSMLEQNSANLSAKSNEIISLCNNLSQLLKSNDSTLSVSFYRIGESLGTAKNKVAILLSNLESEIHSYQERTIANEEKLNANLEKINSELDDIATIFNNIANDKV